MFVIYTEDSDLFKQEVLLNFKYFCFLEKAYSYNCLQASLCHLPVYCFCFQNKRTSRLLFCSSATIVYRDAGSAIKKNGIVWCAGRLLLSVNRSCLWNSRKESEFMSNLKCIWGIDNFMKSCWSTWYRQSVWERFLIEFAKAGNHRSELGTVMLRSGKCYSVGKNNDAWQSWQWACSVLKNSQPKSYHLGESPFKVPQWGKMPQSPPSRAAIF